MRLAWVIDESDIQCVRSFVQLWADDELVKGRKRQNLSETQKAITKETFWERLVGCLLTTQQRSSPGSPVNRFTELVPFPLGYEVCKRQPNLEEYARATLVSFGGIRRWTIVPRQLRENLDRLEGGLWIQVLELVNEVNQADDAGGERRAAHFLDEKLLGLGPKQSRNLLQWLGTSRYEIPIDSRVIKWLSVRLLSFAVSPGLLSDGRFYDLVSDGIQAVCKGAGVYPCVFDAAVFSSFDKGAWSSNNPMQEPLPGA